MTAKKKQPKDKMLTVRITEQEKTWLKEKAQRAGFESVSEFLLDCARKDRRGKA